jgi:hypothetical protein
MLCFCFCLYCCSDVFPVNSLFLEKVNGSITRSYTNGVTCINKQSLSTSLNAHFFALHLLFTLNLHLQPCTPTTTTRAHTNASSSINATNHLTTTSSTSERFITHKHHDRFRQRRLPARPSRRRSHSVSFNFNLKLHGRLSQHRSFLNSQCRP